MKGMRYNLRRAVTEASWQTVVLAVALQLVGNAIWWAFTRSIPEQKWLTGIGFIVIILGMAIIFLWFMSPREGRTVSGRAEVTESIEFYPDRLAVDRVYGGLQNELEAVADAWTSWASGTYYNLIANELKAKISRMIFIAPNSELLRQLAKNDVRSYDELATEIGKAAKSATAERTQVAYSDKPVMYCVIGDPKDRDSAWARLQIYLPNTDSPKWPNVVIHRKKAPRTFDRVLEAYELMFRELTENDRK